MIDHVSLGVADLSRARRFYEPVLAELGLTLLVERAGTLGFGKRYPEFWLNLREGMPPVDKATGVHVCLRATSDAAVDAFHATALEQGGTDDGAPGPRQAAMTTYHGAFVRDPDGNRLEAVCFPRG